MSAGAALAAVPIVGLAGLVIAHLCLVRLLRSRGILVPFLLASAGGGLVGGALHMAVLRVLQVGAADAGALSLLNGLTYLVLAFVYFNLVNMNLTSLRVRLLRELLERQPTGMPPQELLSRYGAEEVLRLRLDRLTRSGHLVYRVDRYYTGKRGIVLIAMVFDLLAWLIFPRKTGKQAMGAEGLG